MRLDSRVPPERGGERHAGRRGHVPDRVVGQPPAAAHLQQLVGVRRHGIGAQRCEVLIGKRIANQRIVRLIAAPRIRAERGRDEPDLKIESSLCPRPDTEVQGVGFRGSDVPAVLLFRDHVLASQFAEQRDVTSCPQRRREIEAQHAQHGILVVGVVEEPGIGAIRRSPRDRRRGSARRRRAQSARTAATRALVLRRCRRRMARGDTRSPRVRSRRA